MVGRLAGMIVLSMVVAGASGCLISKGSSVSESGSRVSGETLGRITPGETTESWLRATAGEPTSRRAVDERRSVLRYDHTICETRRGKVFLLFSGSDRSQRTTSTIFEVTDGVVTAFWTESSA